MPRLKRTLARLPSLKGMRLGLSIHIEIKMVPFIEGLIKHGAKVFFTTCNTETVRDDVVDHLMRAGASVEARRGMSPSQMRVAIRHILEWGPTHLAEMGADLTQAIHSGARGGGKVRASVEATGSGLSSLEDLKLRYPVMDMDTVPIKAGLHNRYMVGITTWQAFYQHTLLTLHEKKVLVIGYGPVGRGVADAARAYGGMVLVAERDPGRAIEAAYAGWNVVPLVEGLQCADVVVTATGAARIIGRKELALLRPGAFLINVGHRPDEIDSNAVLWAKPRPIRPHVESLTVRTKTVFLFAKGYMANLAAGHGDSLNAFDIPISIFAAGIGYIAKLPPKTPKELLSFPEALWKQVLS